MASDPTPFLRQVARHYFDAGDCQRRCFVFPNRRALAFFSHWLSLEAKRGGRPMLSPQLLTVNDFFYRASGLRITDRVTLLLELHECYSRQFTKRNPGGGRRPETLDEFVFWGDVLISDFGDVDKYLVDAKQVFTDISQYRAIDGGFDWIEDEAQRKAVERLAGHFRSGGDEGVKGSFLRLWDMLLPIYDDFNKTLSAKGMAYEGMAYRALAEAVAERSVADVLGGKFHGCGSFVFVGLNALCACEKKVMSAMRKAALAEFCWDFSSPLAMDAENQASKFMRENIAAFPQAFPIDGDGLGFPEIEVIAVPSAVGQTSVAGKVLAGLARSGGNATNGGQASVEADVPVDVVGDGGSPFCANPASSAGNMSVEVMQEKRNADDRGSGRASASHGAAEMPGERAGGWMDTAIVLPDEKLLLPLLGAVPPEVGDINVTMGYPMSGSSFYALLMQAATMQLHSRKLPDGSFSFYHRQVRAILSNDVFRAVAYGGDGGDTARKVAREVIHAAKYYVPQADFSRSPILAKVFRPVVGDLKAADQAAVGAFCDYLRELVLDFAVGLRRAAEACGGVDVGGLDSEKVEADGGRGGSGPGSEKVEADGGRGGSGLDSGKAEAYGDMRGGEASDSQNDAVGGGKALELSFAKCCYTALQQLSDKHLAVLPQTFVLLLQRLLSGLSVPFDGEPLKGLQIMGPLETRALDFRNLILLSANEDVFPRRSVAPSLIPPELRLGFGLPTYEHQDRVWAYYFYRMIQRASKVWLIYDSRTEGVNKGEESRYIKQLVYQYRDQFGLSLRRRVAVAHVCKAVLAELPKTEEDVATIRKRGLSASSIETYLTCPAKFCFAKVKGLKAEAEVSEFLDGAMTGTVYHTVMQAIFLGGEAMSPGFDHSRKHCEAYRGLPFVSADYLRGWLSPRREGKIQAKVTKLIRQQMRSQSVGGRDIVTRNLIVRYVQQTLRSDLDFLRACNADGFSVKGLEKPGEWDCGGFPFSGYIDRIDACGGRGVRVVDYKTGRVGDDERVLSSEERIDSAVQKLFKKPYGGNDRPKILIQMYLYDRFLERAGIDPATIGNYVYEVTGLFSRSVEPMFPEPGLVGHFLEKVGEGLETLLSEIASTSVGFPRTDDERSCQWCDFKNICGR